MHAFLQKAGRPVSQRLVAPPLLDSDSIVHDMAGQLAAGVVAGPAAGPADHGRSIHTTSNKFIAPLVAGRQWRRVYGVSHVRAALDGCIRSCNSIPRPAARRLSPGPN